MTFGLWASNSDPTSFYPDSAQISNIILSHSHRNFVIRICLENLTRPAANLSYSNFVRADESAKQDDGNFANHKKPKAKGTKNLRLTPLEYVPSVFFRETRKSRQGELIMGKPGPVVDLCFNLQTPGRRELAAQMRFSSHGCSASRRRVASLQLARRQYLANPAAAAHCLACGGAAALCLARRRRFASSGDASQHFS